MLLALAATAVMSLGATAGGVKAYRVAASVMREVTTTIQEGSRRIHTELIRALREGAKEIEAEIHLEVVAEIERTWADVEDWWQKP